MTFPLLIADVCHSHAGGNPLHILDSRWRCAGITFLGVQERYASYPEGKDLILFRCQPADIIGIQIRCQPDKNDDGKCEKASTIVHRC